MMTAAQRDDEFVAHLASERRVLREPKVVRIRRPTTTIRQGCFDTNLTWVLSRNRRGSGNASTLLSTRSEADTSLDSARVATFAANASSTRRASTAARLFFAAMIRCAHVAVASAELR
jgi:hypothetical protein